MIDESWFRDNDTLRLFLRRTGATLSSSHGETKDQAGSSWTYPSRGVHGTRGRFTVPARSGNRAVASTGWQYHSRQTQHFGGDGSSFGTGLGHERADLDEPADSVRSGESD